MRTNSVLLLAIVLLLPVAAFAQTPDSSTVNTAPFTVSVNPQYPAPYSQATLSFLSSTLDLTNSTLTISVGGTQTYQGSVQPTTVTLGKAGSVTTVKITISSAGTAYKDTLTIQPQDVSLIAEPVASVPVLYQGKALTPIDGDTRLVAIANMRDAAGKIVDPANLSYSWTVDDTQIANSSGIGKQSIIIASPLQYRNRTVSVTVQSQDGNLVGGDTFSINPVEPTVRIYENDPLLGIRFDHALSDSYSILGSESSLFTAPFSFPTTSGAPVVQWFLNGASAQTGNSITLRPAGAGQGTASLSVTASGGVSSIVSAQLSLLFGSKPSTSLFFGL